jgi:hypothetical protein
MIKARINELVDTIPTKSKIYSEPADHAGTADLMINRRAHALLDAAFPWKYAQAFAQLRKLLPPIVTEFYIRTAYDHLLGRVTNGDINEALIIQHPRWTTKRGFLEALLLFPNLRLDEVAAHVGISVSTVIVYEQLFFNVRDRLYDELFVNEICYPDTKLIEYRSEYWETVEPRDLIFRAAYNNDLDTVLHIFGSRKPSAEQSSDVSAKNVKERILAGADFVVRAGGVNSQIPVLDAARRIIVAGEKATANQNRNAPSDALSDVGMTYGESIRATIMGLTGGDVGNNAFFTPEQLNKPHEN